MAFVIIVDIVTTKRERERERVVVTKVIVAFVGSDDSIAVWVQRGLECGNGNGNGNI